MPADVEDRFAHGIEKGPHFVHILLVSSQEEKKPSLLSRSFRPAYGSVEKSNPLIAGPLSSFFLSAFFYILLMNTAGGSKALFAYLAQINFFIGVFNLIPGFPMDGGRVLRSVIWRRKRDYFYATQKASSVGRMIALFFIFFGLFSIFTGGPGGLWLMLIGWCLYSAAQASYQQSTLQETLSGIKVKDIMVTDLKTLSPSMTLDKAVDEYFLRYGYGGFPVIDDGKFLGIDRRNHSRT